MATEETKAGTSKQPRKDWGYSELDHVQIAGRLTSAHDPESSQRKQPNELVDYELLEC